MKDLSEIKKSIDTLIEKSRKRDKGEKGDKGDKGDRGFDGKNGKDGRDGYDGLDGIDGIDGKNGRDGKDGERGVKGDKGDIGEQGFNGSPDTPHDIKVKLESLQGNQKLDASAIKGLSTLLLGGGGGSSAGGGTSLSGTINQIAYFDSATTIASLTTATYPSLTELSYVKGVTSAIQTQLDLKAPIASPTFTGTVTIPTPFTLGAVSVTSTGTQLNYLSGATGTTGTTTTNVVFSTSPTLVTPVLGAATATTINGNTFTTGTYTLTGAASKTLTFNNTLTLAGTDGTTLTFPSTSATIARTDAGQTFTGVQVMTSPDVATSLTTPSTTFALLNATATTVNAFGATTTLNIGASATCILNFGGSTTASEFRFLEPSGSGTNYSAFKAVAQSANITYSLPPTVGAANTFLTDVAGNGVLTWATASSTDRVDFSFAFEAAARYAAEVETSGTNTFNTNGLTQTTGASSAASAGIYCNAPTGTSEVYADNPSFSAYIATAAIAGTHTSVWQIGRIQPVGASAPSFNFVLLHLGFKDVSAAGTQTSSATNADGTTETATALTAFGGSTAHRLSAKSTTGTNIKYYVDGTLAATHTTNMPAAGDVGRIFQCAIATNNTTSDVNHQVVNVSVGYDI